MPHPSANPENKITMLSYNSYTSLSTFQMTTDWTLKGFILNKGEDMYFNNSYVQELDSNIQWKQRKHS